MPEHLVTLYCCMATGCTKTYNTKFNLKRHVETHHSRLKPFKCTACPSTFRQACQLALHKRSHLACADRVLPSLSSVLNQYSPNSLWC